MKRTAAQRRKDKARNKIRRQHYVVHCAPPRGMTKVTAIIDDDAQFTPTTFLKASGLILSTTGNIPLHKTTEEYMSDAQSALAELPVCDRTQENESILLANVIRTGMGLAPLALKRNNDHGEVHEVQPASGDGNNTSIVPNT